MTLRRIALQAIFFSLIIHVLILNLFSFRLPFKKPPFQPSLNFLGSFLEPYDTQVINKNPPQITIKDQKILTLSHQQKHNPHISAKTDRALLFHSLPASKKKTLPNYQVILPEISSNTDKKQKDVEPFEYTPLKLPEHDRY